MGNVFAQANRVSEVGIRVQLDDKMGRAALAAQARKNAVEDAVAAQEHGTPGMFSSCSDFAFHVGLRRTGGGAISLTAFSTSFAASCVASIASSRFSL